jgi:dihydroflavonol-4-reductase
MLPLRFGRVSATPQLEDRSLTGNTIPLLLAGGIILVTGGTGFTGSHLVKSLARDHRVRVVSRSAARAARILPPGVEIVEGDISDPAVADRAVAGCEMVFNLAAAFREPGIQRQRYAEVHIEGTRHLLESSLRHGIRRFVHCSTVGVLSHIENPPADETWPYSPGDVYQSTKAEGEKLALSYGREQGVPVTVARPTPIYGPGDTRLLKLFRMISHRRFMMLGHGNVFFHLVHVRDLVRGLRLLASHPDAIGEVFILGGEEYRTLNEVVELIAEGVGVPRPRWKLPARPFQLAGTICEKICVPLGITPPIYRRRVDFFTKSRAFSIEKAKRILGYLPNVDLTSGIRETISWYREQGLLPRQPRLRPA